jgi:hypothetical protein
MPNELTFTLVIEPGCEPRGEPDGFTITLALDSGPLHALQATISGETDHGHGSGPDRSSCRECALPPKTLGDSRARLCPVCGFQFTVNPRHRADHRFCSASCRSRSRHDALRKLAAQARAAR